VKSSTDPECSSRTFQFYRVIEFPKKMQILECQQVTKFESSSEKISVITPILDSDLQQDKESNFESLNWNDGVSSYWSQLDEDLYKEDNKTGDNLFCFKTTKYDPKKEYLQF